MINSFGHEKRSVATLPNSSQLQAALNTNLINLLYSNAFGFVNSISKKNTKKSSLDSKKITKPKISAKSSCQRCGNGNNIRKTKNITNTDLFNEYYIHTTSLCQSAFGESILDRVYSDNQTLSTVVYKDKTCRGRNNIVAIPFYAIKFDGEDAFIRHSSAAELCEHLYYQLDINGIFLPKPTLICDAKEKYFIFCFKHPQAMAPVGDINSTKKRINQWKYNQTLIESIAAKFNIADARCKAKAVAFGGNGRIPTPNSLSYEWCICKDPDTGKIMYDKDTGLPQMYRGTKRYVEYMQVGDVFDSPKALADMVYPVKFEDYVAKKRDTKISISAERYGFARSFRWFYGRLVDVLTNLQQVEQWDEGHREKMCFCFYNASILSGKSHNEAKWDTIKFNYRFKNPLSNEEVEDKACKKGKSYIFSYEGFVKFLDIPDELVAKYKIHKMDHKEYCREYTKQYYDKYKKNHEKIALKEMVVKKVQSLRKVGLSFALIVEKIKALFGVNISVWTASRYAKGVGPT